MSYLDMGEPKQRAKLVVDTIAAVRASGDLELAPRPLRAQLEEAVTQLSQFETLTDADANGALALGENALDELRKLMLAHTPPTPYRVKDK